MKSRDPQCTSYFVAMLYGCWKPKSHSTKINVSKFYCMMISLIFVFNHCLGEFEKGDTIWSLNNINNILSNIMCAHYRKCTRTRSWLLGIESDKMLTLLLRWAKDTLHMSHFKKHILNTLSTRTVTLAWM